MRLKKVCLIVLIFGFLITPLSFANIEEDEQIDFSQINQEIISTSAETANIPNINSRSAVVLDRTTKTILFAKSENEVRKMASTTKIMTAIVVIENSNLYDTVTISKKAASIGGSSLGIKEGDKITICDLLYGLLLKSGNDTAIALAESVGGSVEGFADIMNKKAKELNLVNTHFVTPHGLDNDNHFTTAYELAVLTDYALSNKIFYNFVSCKSYTVTINGVPKTISNTNELLGNLNGVYGVKTGFTNGANRCLVTACKRDNLDIICVVLGADTKKYRTQDSIKLIEQTFKTYQMLDLEEIVTNTFKKWKKENINNFVINKSASENLDLELKDLNYKLYPIRKEGIGNIATSVECTYNLDSPLKSNSCIGKLFVYISDNLILEYEIVNTNNIDRKNCFNYIEEFLSNFFKYLTISY